MKVLGLIGGMSWESTAVYYRLLNEGIKARLGGFHSAELLLASVDFASVEAWQHAGEWDQAGAALAGYAKRLEGAGAEAIMLCTNTMHKVSPAIEAAIEIPLLHVADAVGGAVRGDGHRRALLLGTRYTMEQDFIRERLARFGFEVLVPEEAERERVDRVIYQELCHGRVIDASRAAYVAIIERMASRAGVEAVVLGCTEIGMLLCASDVGIPVYDSTELHAGAGVDFALER